MTINDFKDTVRDLSSSDRQQLDDVYLIFRRFDRDNDGFISINELTSGLRTMGIFLTAEERDALMNKFDTNKDGNISDAEIYNVLSSINTKDLAS